jgi:AmmeMemoRadiSam system protein A
MAHTSSTDDIYDAEARATLHATARASIEQGVAHGTRLDVDATRYPELLREPKGCFVTLHIDAALRGCVGSLQPRGPLIAEVARAAHSAAFEDPRFPAMTREEVGGLDVHISVLSTPRAMTFDSEASLLAQLRPGIDGLILRDGPHMGTFLPAVWEKLKSPAAFLAQLRLKAGLSKNHWSAHLRMERYTTESF